ncbi:MAG: gliding motility-associated C-terminal domain-containing protein [bacterium]|nr:gliding motility-associated C-terminal domain-containing protein [bacterium]
MKDIENIDELIKQGMSDFTPLAPPDAWDAIAQQLPTAPVAQPTVPKLPVNSVLQAIKGLSVGVKLGVGLLLPVSVGLGIAFWPNSDVVEVAQMPVVNEDMVQASTSADSINEVVKANLVQTEKKLSKAKKLPIQNNNLVSNTKGQKNGLQREQGLGKGENVKTDSYSEPIAKNLTHQEGNKQEGEVAIGGVGDKRLGQGSSKENLGLADKTALDHVGSMDEKPAVPEEKAAITSVPKLDPEFGNAFSPNGDGKNDTWEIRMDKPVYFLLRIIDRRGQLVYESDQPEKSWSGLNGKTGVDCEVGTYSYILEYQFEKNEKIKVKQGFINLIR